ncbi:MAG: hypothetical protein EOM20_09775 [Spartobacteria bacterium]|nr:hypothetical protein [Spartobacteria bacterium]
MKRIMWTLLIAICVAAASAQETIWEREISEEEMYAFLEQNLPRQAEDLRALAAINPVEYAERMKGMTDGIRRYYEVKQQNPQAAENMLEAHRMEYQCGELADRIVAADDPARKQELTSELHGKLLMVFDLHLAENQRHADMLRGELTEIEAMLEKRKAAKDRIIQRRLEELIAQRDQTLQWW